MKIDASTNLLSGKDVVQMKSPNTKGEDISAKLDTVIIHYTAGTSAKGSAAWLCNPQAGASAHLVIGREGEIYQLIPFTTKAWHAGVSQYQGRKGFNNYSIGIELDNAGPLKRSDRNTSTNSAGNSAKMMSCMPPTLTVSLRHIGIPTPRNN